MHANPKCPVHFVAVGEVTTHCGASTMSVPALLPHMTGWILAALGPTAARRVVYCEVCMMAEARMAVERVARAAPLPPVPGAAPKPRDLLIGRGFIGRRQTSWLRLVVGRFPDGNAIYETFDLETGERMPWGPGVCGESRLRTWALREATREEIAGLKEVHDA